MTPITDCEETTNCYFTHARPEMLSFIPADCHRLLDVGCGAGAFGETLKRTRKIEVWGMEPVSSAANEAASKLDRVVVGEFSPKAGLPEGAFDCITFNDVLEHMVAPEEALRYAQYLLSPAGVVIASIPNIRHLEILWGMGVRGRWEYADAGLLDRTHLRFFTKSSILKLFRSEGYAVQQIVGINPFVAHSTAGRCLYALYKLVNALFFGKLSDMNYYQFATVARPEKPSFE